MTRVIRIARWLRRRRAQRRRFNPYAAGTPVFDSSLLFGRDSLTARTLGLLSSRSVRLTGEHRIGKTSFLHHLQKALTSEGGLWGFVPVFVDLEAVTAPRVSRVLMEETVEELAHDVRRVVRNLRERTRADARLVLLVDEVDAVLPGPESEPWLDALLEGCSEELRVVLAGVNGQVSRRGASRHERGRMEELVLEPLHPDDARALVTRPVAHCFRYEPRAVERIVQLAEGRPYLLQKLCLNALNRMLDEGRSVIRLADVESSADLMAVELPGRPSAGANGSAASA
jgi:type II secretory pathway predicted ATPase ExeA